MGKTLKPLKFAEFINKDWDRFFSKLLSEAREKAAGLLGAQNVSKMPILFGSHTGDPAYLSQFHAGMPHRAVINSNGEPSVEPMPINNLSGKTNKSSLMAHALKHRYNDALVAQGQHYDTHGELAKDQDTTKELKFKLPQAVNWHNESEYKIRKKLNKSALSLLDDEQAHKLVEAKRAELVKTTPYYIVYSQVDGKDVYTGHTELAEKLTKGVQTLPEKDDDTPILRDIDEKNPDYKEKLEKYLKKFGLFNLDISNMKDEAGKIDSMSDDEVIQTLPKEQKILFANLRSANGEPIPEEKKYELPKVRQMINIRRKQMKENVKKKATGYAPIEMPEAKEVSRDWLNATAMGLFDPSLKDKKEVPDPLNPTANVPLYWLSPEEAEKLTNRKIGHGFDPKEQTRGDIESDEESGEEVKPVDKKWQKILPGKRERLGIPVIKRSISYQIQNVDRAILETHTDVPIFAPYLPDMKTIPQLPKGIPDIRLNDEQKALLAHRKYPDKIPQDTPENMAKTFRNIMDDPNVNRKLKEDVMQAATLQDFANIIKHWDIFTDKQKEYIKNNMEDLVQVAKAVHDKNDEHYDAHRHAYIVNHMSPGYSANKGKTKQDALQIYDKDVVGKLIEKYIGQMASEAYIGISNWLSHRSKVSGQEMEMPKGVERQYFDSKFGKNEKGESYKVGSPGRGRSQPAYVLSAISSATSSISAVYAYWLLTLLNSEDKGIYDPEVGLDKPKSEAILANNGNSPEAAKRRINVVYNLLDGLAQVSLEGHPSRRARLKALTGSQVSGQSKGGEEGDEDVDVADLQGFKNKASSQKSPEQSQADKKSTLMQWTQKHSFRRKDIPFSSGMLADKTLKLGGRTETIPGYMSNLARGIHIHLLGEADPQIDKAATKVTITLEQAQMLYEKYYNELANQIPDEEERKKAASEKVKQELPEDLKNDFNIGHTPEGETYTGNAEREPGVDYSVDDPEFKNKFTKSMDEFWADLIENEEAELPMYNRSEKAFEPSKMVYLAQKFKQPESNAANPTQVSWLVDRMKKLYEEIAKAAGDANPQDVNEVIQKGLDDNVVDIWSAIRMEHGLPKVPYKDMVSHLVPLGVYPHNWQKFADANALQKQPMPVQAPQQAPAIAARPINDLIGDLSQDWMNKPTTTERINALIRAYASITQRANELLQLPKEQIKGLIYKLRAADLNAYWKIVQKMVHNNELTEQEAQKLDEPRKQYGELLKALGNKT